MAHSGASAREHHDVTQLVSALLDRAVASRATDLHFEPSDDRLRVRLRLDGMLTELEHLPRALMPNVISRLKVLASLLTYRTDIPQEGSLQWPPEEGGAWIDGRSAASAFDEGVRDLRVATFPTIRGERVVVRIFRQRLAPQSLEDLGFPPDQARLLEAAVEQPDGLIAVCGPAGSGKTTTLYALLRHLRDRFPQRSLITLEDPVEQRLDAVTQIQINPYGELDYERCLRSLLRQDPQVLLIGEIRDARTADVVMQAALTGHLILTTLHSQDTASAIVRFLEMGIPAYQLVSTLSAVCAQRLIRTVCRRCAVSRARDCADCLGTGFHGRTALPQVCGITEEVRGEILRNPPASELRRTLARGSPSMREQGQRLVRSGLTTAEELSRVLGGDAASA